MHSRIFQVSTKPIEKDNYIDIDDVFNERYMDWGCESESSHKSDIQWMLDMVPEGVFTYDKRTRYITYTGDIAPILEKWQEIVDDAYNGVKGNIIDSMGRFRLADRIENPIGGFLFVIEEWSGRHVERSDGFVEWLSSLTPGQKIYIGAILDYHF